MAPKWLLISFGLARQGEAARTAVASHLTCATMRAMIPEERVCGFCKRKIDKSKRADAVYCSHACKLAAHRQEQRDEAEKTEARAAPHATTAIAVLEAPNPLPPALRAPWDLYGSQPTQRTSRSVNPNQEHPTEWPLRTDELAELLLRNSRPSYKGYRLFLTIPQPDGSEHVYAYPSGNKLSLRFDGREKLKPWFKLRPFEPPVIPMKGIYTVWFLDEYVRHVKGGHGVSRGVHLQPEGCVSGLEDGDFAIRKRK